MTKGICLDASQFDISRHNGEITLSNPAKGTHRTFRIRTARSGKLEGLRIVSLLIGQDNETSYQGFGFAEPDGTVRVWNKHRGPEGEPSLYERYADLLARPGHWATKGVEYHVSARCRRCGRKLTVVASIESGYGPECIQKV